MCIISQIFNVNVENEKKIVFSLHMKENFFLDENMFKGSD